MARCRFTLHDFRQLFATDLVNHGLPIHIAAAVLGHLDVHTTHGNVAVFQGLVHALCCFPDRGRVKAAGSKPLHI